MKSKTFRLQETDIEQLERFAKQRGISQSDAIRFAIQNLQNEIHEEPPAGEGDGVVSELIRQLQVKDQQIASLSQALVSAQETAKAAQVLQAQSMAGLPAADQGEKKQSFWERWFS